MDMAENIKVGTIFFTVRLEVGGKNAHLRFDAPLWLELGNYALWFKNYNAVLTGLFSAIFGGFGFSVSRSELNREGYYAKFSTGPQSFRASVKLIRRLFGEGLLTLHASEGELAKKCVLRKLGAEK
jgi:hypothetical protein